MFLGPLIAGGRAPCDCDCDCDAVEGPGSYGPGGNFRLRLAGVRTLDDYTDFLPNRGETEIKKKII